MSTNVITKSDLVNQLSETLGVSKVKSQSTLDAILVALQDNLQKGNNISLTGFGTFKVNERKAREGRNPKTGEKIKIPAKKVVTFKPGKGLSEIVAKK